MDKPLPSKPEEWGDDEIIEDKKEASEAYKESVVQMLNRVFKHDKTLKRVAYLLYIGCAVSSNKPGNLGIMQRLNLRKYQFDRALARVRMLLDGELGAKFYRQ